MKDRNVISDQWEALVGLYDDVNKNLTEFEKQQKLLDQVKYKQMLQDKMGEKLRWKQMQKQKDD